MFQSQIQPQATERAVGEGSGAASLQVGAELGCSAGVSVLQRNPPYAK